MSDFSRTEHGLQLRLWQKFNSRDIHVPNVYAYGNNESDYLTVTKAGYVDEYEIKVTRADFFADQKKDRHELYQVVTPWRRWLRAGGAHWPDRTEIRLSTIPALYPNRFWYVVPEGIVDVEDVPSYAGLLVLHHSLTVVKRAPQLHKEKIPDAKKAKLINTGYRRYLGQWVDRAYDAQHQAVNRERAAG